MEVVAFVGPRKVLEGGTEEGLNIKLELGLDNIVCLQYCTQLYHITYLVGANATNVERAIGKTCHMLSFSFLSLFKMKIT